VRAAAAPRWRLLLVTAATTLTVGFVFGMTRTRGGWLTLSLAVAAAVMLSGRARKVLVLAEWTVIAVLAVLLATSVGPQPGRPPLPRHHAAAAAGGLCPPAVEGVAGAACRQVDQWWRQANAWTDGHSPTKDPTKGKEGR
jgi:hypothetical protein